MTLSPKQMEQAWSEASDLNIEEFDRYCRQLLDLGWLVWSKQPPRKRIAFYTSITDPLDMQLVLDADYRKKHEAGLAPGLVSPTWQKYWMIPMLYDHYSSDFRSLLRGIGRQVEGEMSVTQPVVSTVPPPDATAGASTLEVYP